MQCPPAPGVLQVVLSSIPRSANIRRVPDLRMPDVITSKDPGRRDAGCTDSPVPGDQLNFMHNACTLAPSRNLPAERRPPECICTVRTSKLTCFTVTPLKAGAPERFAGSGESLEGTRNHGRAEGDRQQSAARCHQPGENAEEEKEQVRKTPSRERRTSQALEPENQGAAHLGRPKYIGL